MTFPLTCFHLILNHSKVQGQGHAHFNSQYLANGDSLGKYCYGQQIESLGFRLSDLNMTLTGLIRSLLKQISTEGR